VRAALVPAAIAASLLSLLATPAAATSAARATRVAGESRYATAAAVAEAAFSVGATSAVLARGDQFADALTGAALAGAVGGPVLLTTPEQLDAEVATALDELGVADVRVLGGTSAIADEVVAEIASADRTVTRIAGANRYATAAAVAGSMAAGEIDGASAVIVASGEVFADALSVGAVAAWARVPILLTTASSLPTETADALRSLDADRVLVVGGTAAVSDAVVSEIRSLGPDVERLAGASRAATATRIADFAIEKLGWDASRAILARSDVFADGLAGGPLGAAIAGPVILTAPASLDPAARDWLAQHEPTIEQLTILGGDAAVPPDVADAAVIAAGGQVATGDDALGLTGKGTSVVPYGGTRACTLAAPGGASVHVRVAPSSDVESTDDGSITFVDADGDGTADLAGSAAEISTIDDRTVSPPTPSADVTGPTELGLRAASYASAMVVAFVDGAEGKLGVLDVDDDGHPTDEAVVGCPSTFAPPEALAGTYGAVSIGVADSSAGVVVDVQDSRTFTFDDADTFRIEGAAATFDAFAQAASAGDVIDIQYTTGASSFHISSDVVQPTGKPVPIAKSLDESGAYNDVEVAFAIPAWNGEGTRYTITRARTQLADGECTAAIAATATNEGTTTTSPFDDLAVPDGCYLYRVIAISSAGTTATSPFSDPVRLPGAAVASDVNGPRSTYSAVTTNAGSATLGNGDVVSIAFDEPLAPPSSASITVRSGTGMSATFAAGSGATFSRNATSVTVGGTSRAPNTVLTIHVTNDPASPVDLPADVTSASGITDAGSTTWDLAGSPDTRLESAST
jgi:putative cell wall-binding protein